MFISTDKAFGRAVFCACSSMSFLFHSAYRGTFLIYYSNSHFLCFVEISILYFFGQIERLGVMILPPYENSMADVMEPHTFREYGHVAAAHPWQHRLIRLSLLAESTSHLAMFFYHNKSANGIFCHGLSLDM